MPRKITHIKGSMEVIYANLSATKSEKRETKFRCKQPKVCDRYKCRKPDWGFRDCERDKRNKPQRWGKMSKEEKESYNSEVTFLMMRNYYYKDANKY
jgi:hypothetical protein